MNGISASRPPITAYLALAVGILALSLSAMFVRWADAPGAVTGFYRLMLSTLWMTPFAVGQLKQDLTLNRSFPLFPILAGIFTALDFGLWNTAAQYTTASNVTLLGNTAPLWVAVFTWLFLRKRLKRQFWLGLILSIIGSGLIFGSDLGSQPRLGIGDLMALGAGFFYAGYYLCTQQSRIHFGNLSHIWLVGISGSLGLLVINLLLCHPLNGYSLETCAVFLATALVSQTIGYQAVSYALGHLPAWLVSPTMFLQPVVTTLLAIPLLGEVPEPLHFAGGGAVLLGIILIHQSHARQQAIR